MHPVWTLVHAERAALLADLRELSSAAWQAPSLCPGWTVRDVTAHLINVAETTPWSFLWGMVRTGFDFDQQNQVGVHALGDPTPAEVLDHLDQVSERTSGPPRVLAPLDSRLVEEVAHGEDIRRPLGIRHAYQPDAVVQAITYQARTSTNFGGAKEQVAGVQLVADDIDFQFGDGPRVKGPALEILMLVSGRDPRPDSLTGPDLGRQ